MRRRFRAVRGPLLGLLCASIVLAGCRAAAPTPHAPAPAAAAATDRLKLPPPLTDGQMSLESALGARQSIRDFQDRALSIEEISQLFWAAQGVTRPWGGRTAPSAGALYPLELYAATGEGVYRYLPQQHQAELWLADDVRQLLWAAGLRQEALQQAPAIFVITAVYGRTSAKYGERAERYVELEAGHTAQNLLLQVAALALGAVPIGAFDDAEVAAALSLPPEEVPLYLIPVGHPTE